MLQSKGPNSFSCIWIFNFPRTNHWKNYLSSLSGLHSFVKKSFDNIYKGWFVSSLFYSIGLNVCLYASKHCFDYYGFVVRFVISKCETSYFKKIFWVCSGNVGSLEVPYEFYNGFSYFCKNIIRILIVIELNL